MATNMLTTDMAPVILKLFDDWRLGKKNMA